MSPRRRHIVPYAPMPLFPPFPIPLRGRSRAAGEIPRRDDGPVSGLSEPVRTCSDLIGPVRIRQRFVSTTPSMTAYAAGWLTAGVIPKYGNGAARGVWYETRIRLPLFAVNSIAAR
jgi:hypothetical protein